MVATSSTSMYFSGKGLSVVSGPPSRQSSLRSVSSTHSRGSFKVKPDVCNPELSVKRRVHFSKESTDTGESFEKNAGNRKFDNEIVSKTVIEFEPSEPLEHLYLSCGDILRIRSDARTEACQFAQVYPNFIDDINNIFENGGTKENILNQINMLRRRRRRLDPYDAALESVDRDDDLESIQKNTYWDGEQECNNDEFLDDTLFFSTMRGLEVRACPIFRLNRRLAIRNVLDLQREMNNSGCSPTQITMGLRALYAQISQKARDFAKHQAFLDEYEIRFK